MKGRLRFSIENRALFLDKNLSLSNFCALYKFLLAQPNQPTSYIRRMRFLEKFKGFLRQGATPKALAASSTVGLLLGVFPMLGVTTLMMGAISVRWKLNLPLMLAVSYLIYPLQIVLMIPFVRVGEWLTGVAHADFSLDKMADAFAANFTAALVDLGTSNLVAILGWCLLSLPVAALLYLVLLPIFRLALAKSSGQISG